jgi:AAA family ATP:ADP antiporter
MIRAIQRLLHPIVDLRDEEVVGSLLMFAYSFLAMTAYNILKPITRSQFIADLGAQNLPYVLLVAGLLIGFIMQGYSRLAGVIPRKAVIPVTQVGLAAVLVVFWVLFKTDQQWVSAAFYLLGLILGILLISQFWTLANEVYDPRQAKRMFGFIGGGSSLGGIAGSSILRFATDTVGTNNLLLLSAVMLVACAGLVVSVTRRSGAIELAGVTSTGEEGGGGWLEGLRLLRGSKHLQIIAAVIAFAAIGAGLIEQQLNMAVEAFKGRDQVDTLTKFLGTVQLYTSIAGFVIQIWITSRIQQYLGIGFALLILPVSLGSTGVIMLINAVLWAPSMARVLDTALRYTVDKTTREILFLPLSSDLKQRAKPFVDVTVDRLGKATSALLSLVLIAPWGLRLTWQQLSWASLTVTALWIYTAIKAKQGYLNAFRQSIERREVEPHEVRMPSADLQTIETLLGELSEPDEKRVIYAIDVLEAIDKRNLITPLLLYHESPRVRARAAAVFATLPRDVATRWRPTIRRLLGDENPEVRAAAIGALANTMDESETELARPYLDNDNPRIASTAAVVLARSSREEDRKDAEATLTRLSAPASSSTAARREVAKALRQMPDPQFQSLLVPLLSDPNIGVAREAIRSARRACDCSFLFVPALVSLLRNRHLKSDAREALISFGERVTDTLAFFLSDKEEDIWVRRHIPATLARIPSQKSMDVLVHALADEDDGFLHYKIISAIDRLRREHPELTYDKAPLEAAAQGEAARFFDYLLPYHTLFEQEPLPKDSLLAQALREKMARAKNRIYLSLGLIYPWRDIVAARWAIERGDARAKASAAEYLDNLLDGHLRRWLMPILDEVPIQERIERGHALLKQTALSLDDTLRRLLNNRDEVLSATTIDLIGRQQRRELTDDLEHVLATRDVHDWYVFEAVSWVLAGFRIEDSRRARWLEPLPAIEMATRLRAIPIFSAVSIDELFRFVHTGRQIRYESGRYLYEAGVVPSDLQLVLEGRLIAEDDSQSRAIDAPAPLGVEEVLENRAMRESIRTLEPSVSLSMSVEDAGTLLADNTDLVQGLFRWMLDHEAFQEEHIVIHNVGVPALAQPSDGAHALRAVDKLLMLQRLTVFTRVPAEERLALAAIVNDVPLVAGQTISEESHAPAVVLLIDGEVSLITTDGSKPDVIARGGDVVGLFETLAGIPLGRQAHVNAAGRALYIRHDDLFDLLGQRPKLLQYMFTALFSQRQMLSSSATV